MVNATRSRRRPFGTVILGALLLAGATTACGEKAEGGPVDPYVPPSFALPDLNPTSPTYLQELSPEDAGGAVLLVYFASFT